MSPCLESRVETIGAHHLVTEPEPNGDPALVQGRQGVDESLRQPAIPLVHAPAEQDRRRVDALDVSAHDALDRVDVVARLRQHAFAAPAVSRRDIPVISPYSGARAERAADLLRVFLRPEGQEPEMDSVRDEAVRREAWGRSDGELRELFPRRDEERFASFRRSGGMRRRRRCLNDGRHEDRREADQEKECCRRRGSDPSTDRHGPRHPAVALSAAGNGAG